MNTHTSAGTGAAVFFLRRIVKLPPLDSPQQE